MYGDFTGLAAVPVIVGIVEVCKRWISDDRWYPVIALIVGIAINVAVAHQTGSDYLLAGLLGIVAGLAAGGLYSGGKAITNPR